MGGLFLPNKTQTWPRISEFALSSWGHCCDMFNDSLYVCVCVQSSITIRGTGPPLGLKSKEGLFAVFTDTCRMCAR